MYSIHYDIQKDGIHIYLLLKDDNYHNFHLPLCNINLLNNCIYFQADSDYIDDYTMLELFEIERFKNHDIFNVIYTFVLLSSLGGGW